MAGELYRGVGRGYMMNDEMFQEYYDKYYVEDRTVQRIARKLAKSDYDLYQDLIQIGLGRLWKLDPSKATTNKDAWIRQAMHFAMIDHLRKLKLRHLESLDRRLENGEQLEADPSTGELRLVRTPKKSSATAAAPDFGRLLREVVEQHAPEVAPEEEQDDY